MFIGGLHRSGTTPLARWMGSHPQVSAFHDTGVHQDEGQHLQDVYPPARRYGGPGRFALAPESGLTEQSSLVSEQGRQRLWAAWAPHWELDRTVLLEKSPPNLVRMRFLQALFPGSYFIVVVRHPLAVAYATKKWAKTSLRSLLTHWEVAHERCLADAPLVEHLALVRYEDLVADPAGQLELIFGFVGLEPHDGDWEVKASLNDAYLRRWERGSLNPIKRLHRRGLERDFEPSAAPWGYSLATPDAIGAAAEPVASMLIAA